MVYVTDTHSIVWYFTENPRLGQRALDAFESTSREGAIIIPAVVLAEIMYISTKARIALTFDETLARIASYDNFTVAPLDVEILKVANGIGEGFEMHDTLIVATAIYHDACLITQDSLITNSGMCRTIW